MPTKQLEQSNLSSTDTHPDIESIYRQWDDALGKKDVEAALALYAPDATLESPLVSHLLRVDKGVCQGRDELKDFLALVFQHTPPSRKRFRKGYFTDGHRVMWEYPRESPDGEQMDFVEVMEIENGLIRRHRVYWGWFGVNVLKKDQYHR
jgi:ketosteroid isomerase-like protein